VKTTTLPLELGEVAPGMGFTRMPMPNYWGLQEGVHSGGPFLDPVGKEVWKPLDVLPTPNAQFRVYTHEVEVLTLMEGVVGFPRNWRVEEANGRRFLVRKLAYPIPEVYEASMLTPEKVLAVEAAQRAINAKGWEIGDLVLRIAIDADTYEPFVLDLSAASFVGKAVWPGADEHLKFEAWAESIAGRGDLVQFRRHARSVVSSAQWAIAHGRTHRWVYGSRYRPVESSWANIPGALFLDGNKAETDVCTWVVVSSRLPDEVVNGFQLEYGWAPIAYED
jgi:hypothetical protein